MHIKSLYIPFPEHIPYPRYPTLPYPTTFIGTLREGGKRGRESQGGIERQRSREGTEEEELVRTKQERDMETCVLSHLVPISLFKLRGCNHSLSP